MSEQAERARLADSGTPTSPWRLWGPYLAGRQWGTVREDYSAGGDAWSSFPFDHARSRAYRWGEDGIAGICDLHGFLNFGLALWNGKDPILKERYFGLTNDEGNHGEDVKEHWWVTDGTPTHSWMQVLYRYPQAEFPYEELRRLAREADRTDREPELADTGVFHENRFFDVTVTYAKADTDDICIRIDATNHGPEEAPLHLLPQLWFRNTWAWGRDDRRCSIIGSTTNGRSFVAEHGQLGRYTLHVEGTPTLLVTDNETNDEALYGTPNPTRFTKDGIDEYVVRNRTTTCQVVGPDDTSEPGTKVAAWYSFDPVEPGETVTIRLRLTQHHHEDPFRDFESTVDARKREADEFFDAFDVQGHEKQVLRKALAGLMWTKQHYRYRTRDWFDGDPIQQQTRHNARNAHWRHIDVADVISMPDEWEYPWFAAWDLAFHTIPFTLVDPAFAKEQLLLLCREWLMHPNGQLPAYEWEFGDVNPPVHAWAALQVYRMDGGWDRRFLAKIFHKLLLNFSWWVNRKDADGSYLFEGGFLGMDNIGPINRSEPMLGEWRLEQSDATSWMAAYSLHLMQIALELAREDESYEDVATKFVEHFLSIAEAFTNFGSTNTGIWNEEDGFCYDRVSNGTVSEPVRVRSMVGLIPLLANAVLEPWVLTDLPGFTSRLNHLLTRRPELRQFIRYGDKGALVSLLDEAKVRRVLHRMFDEHEFLSPHGIRSLSAAHREGLEVIVAGQEHRMGYEPGESHTPMFGGNSNWRGPIWFPINALLVEALETVDGFADGAFRVELPSGSGRQLTAGQAADELARRLVSLFLPDADGRRPSDGKRIEASDHPLWREHVTFSEYFDGDTGEGLGASHQTGWTALVAGLLIKRHHG
ncbi:glucosidase [Lentzea sp. NBRC 105346]|uniref:MGH1-like glycoside hydrolase domain-containing protein n=1 Tax=Lentzea sp. NBRC 105346 TaxID=3032205 RepID=UPI00249F9D29|nr:glucosidase [Lentzea sp. NBRC 105346]GLZ33152.1 glucosidase [Lentzea sp. NBRC 105346]